MGDDGDGVVNSRKSANGDEDDDDDDDVVVPATAKKQSMKNVKYGSRFPTLEDIEDQV